MSRRKLAVWLVVLAIGLGLNAEVVDAATLGGKCTEIGATTKIKSQGKNISIICTSVGKKKVWRAISTKSPSAQTTRATVLSAAGLPFVNMANAVKDYAAQCLLVMSGDEVVAEWNFGSHKSDTKILTASISKSFTNTLVGIAQRKGLLNIDERASKYITEWKSTKSETVTIRQLLAMTSTRGEFNLSAALIDARSLLLTNVVGGSTHATSPGKSWFYHNASTQALEIVLSRATGETVTAFAERELFSPLGMTSTSIGLDSKGVELTFVGFYSTCRDIAKLVRLYLRSGEYNGRQILTQDYVKDSLTPQITSTDASAAMHGGYGLQIWLNRDKGSVFVTTLGPTGLQYTRRAGALYPELATDIFLFKGACRQLAVGAPSQNIAVVMLRPGCDTIEKSQLDAAVSAPEDVFIYQLGKALASVK